MDILFFIGQALAIAGIGYVVCQAFAYAAKHGDPTTWKSGDFPIGSMRQSAQAEMDDAPVQLSFVPESVWTVDDLHVQAARYRLHPGAGVIDAQQRTSADPANTDVELRARAKAA